MKAEGREWDFGGGILAQHITWRDEEGCAELSLISTSSTRSEISHSWSGRGVRPDTIAWPLFTGAILCAQGRDGDCRRRDGSRFGAENRGSERGREPAFLLEEIQFVLRPATFGADGE